MNEELHENNYGIKSENTDKIFEIQTIKTIIDVIKIILKRI